jgi:hypothetical protein
MKLETSRSFKTKFQENKLKHETRPCFTIKFHENIEKVGLKLLEVSSFGPNGWKLDPETS